MVKGLPEISFKKNKIFCESCTQGKQARKLFKSRIKKLSSKPLELIHMDLFGPTRSLSLSGKSVSKTGSLTAQRGVNESE